MKTIIRIAALFCCLVMLCLALPLSAFADNGHIVYALFHLQLRRNTLIAKYGITVWFDEIEVAHLDQGDPLTFGAYMREGEAHQLRFVPDKAGVPVRSWTLANLPDGATVSCTLQTHSSYVDIKQTDIGAGGTALVSVSPDVERQVKILGTVIQIGAKILTRGW